MFRKNSRDKSRAIQFAGRNLITSSNRIQISPLLQVMQFVLIVVGVYGTIFGFISAFDVEINSMVLFVSIVLSTMYFYATFRFPKAGKYSLPISFIIYLMAGYEFWKEIQNGFWFLENAYIDKFNQYYETNIYNYLVGDYCAKEVITILLIFIIIIITAMLCYVVITNALPSLFAIITLPILFGSLTVGHIPNAISLGAYLTCAIGITGMRSTMRDYTRHLNPKSIQGIQKKKNIQLERKFNHMIGLKIGGLLAIVLLSLILLVSVVITPKLYAEKFHIETTKSKIQTEISELSIDTLTKNLQSLHITKLGIFQSSVSSGGLSEGKLGRVGEVKFNYETALRIKTSTVGTNLYLKGYVGSVYKGDRWMELDKSDQKAYEDLAKLWDQSEFEIVNQSSYFLSIIQKLNRDTYQTFDFFKGEMHVESIYANQNYLYAPYYTSYHLDDSVNVMNDEYVYPKESKKEYELNYYHNLNSLENFDAEEEYGNYLGLCMDFIAGSEALPKNENELLQQLAEYRTLEASYREYVYQVYTKMPEKGLEQLIEEFGIIDYQEYKELYDVEALSQLIFLVRNYLNRNTSYSLAPGKLPKNSDFVAYFIYENKLGYCSHYASAATMMLRAMGVPTRYVEGYIVKETDINKGENKGVTTVEGRRNGQVKEQEAINKTIEITDANAHAWIEVYLDGFGWIPVEMTPGYINVGDISNMEDEVINQLEKPHRAQVPTLTPTPSPTPKATIASNENKKAKSIPKQGTKSKTLLLGSNDRYYSLLTYLKKVGSVVIRIMIVLIVITIIIMLRAWFLIAKRKKAQHTKNLSKKVLLRYKEMKRILTVYHVTYNEELTYQQMSEQIERQFSFLQVGNFKRFTEIVLKAQFDYEWISKIEADEAERFYKSFLVSIYKTASIKKKFYLKYIKTLS